MKTANSIRRCLVAGIILWLISASSFASDISFPRGKAAYIVFNPKTPLGIRAAGRLTDYMGKVLDVSPILVRKLGKVPDGAPAIMLSSSAKKSASGINIGTSSPEAFALATTTVKGHPIVEALGNTEQGLKQAVQRLIVKSSQEAGALRIPEMRIAESPWIPQREWTACCWSPRFVRGTFYNDFADQRPDIWRFDKTQMTQYANMFDSFGYNGCQILEACYTYGILGTPEAAQEHERVLAEAVRNNGQGVSLWVWAAQFTGFGWNDSAVIYSTQTAKSQFDDPQVRRTFENQYDRYAKMAPYVDRIFAHFYDPGALVHQSDVFQYLRLLEQKFKAVNPKIQMGVDTWGSQGDYLQSLIDNGFKDYILLTNSMPAQLYPEARRKIHEEAKRLNLQVGVWGWYMIENETDMFSAMFVQPKALKQYYLDIRNGAFQTYPITYWSEMEAYHLNNIYTAYAAGQLLWNPDRDPDEILREISDGIWGPVNGPKVYEALQLIQDLRTGATWNPYTWWTPTEYKLGSGDAAKDAARADAALKGLVELKPDPEFVPKFSLPFPPDTFLELMIPHVRQVKLFAEFRQKVAEVRQAAAGGASKDKLQQMLQAAWQPVPEYNTWVGTCGQIEQRFQEKIIADLCKEHGIKVEDPAWLRNMEEDRLVSIAKITQQSQSKPFLFGRGYLNVPSWSDAKYEARFQECISKGMIEKMDDTNYRLTDWFQYAKP